MFLYEKILLQDGAYAISLTQINVLHFEVPMSVVFIHIFFSQGFINCNFEMNLYFKEKFQQ